MENGYIFKGKYRILRKDVFMLKKGLESGRRRSDFEPLIH